MPTMSYNGKSRTIRRGPRVYDLKRGKFEAHAEDVTALEEVGAKVVDADKPDDTDSQE